MSHNLAPNRAQPRRSAKRWLIDAPEDVIAVYDNNGKTLDRYSVLLNQWYTDRSQLVECLALSDNPTHPMGFSQFTNAARGPHLGRKVTWASLPADVRRHAQVRLTH